MRNNDFDGEESSLKTLTVSGLPEEIISEVMAKEETVQIVSMFESLGSSSNGFTQEIELFDFSNRPSPVRALTPNSNAWSQSALTKYISA